MFIKVHTVGARTPIYLNTDLIEEVAEVSGAIKPHTRIYTINTPLGYDVIEPIDEIMKIIGYFEVRT